MPKKAVSEMERKIERTNNVRNLMRVFNKRNQGYKLNFSFLEVIRALSVCKCCLNKTVQMKKKLYMKSNYYVERFMDITCIINKLEEVEKLKIVILNPEQLALFNFLSKELISQDENKVKNHDITIYKKFCSNKENLANVIVRFKEKLSSNGLLNHMDSKLYSFLHEEFKK